MLKIEKSTEIEKEGEGVFKLIGTLRYQSHDLRVELRARYPQGTVLSANARMDEVPYGDICRETGKLMDSLVGLEIRPGISKEIARMVGGAEGCTHLVDMVLDLSKAFFQINFLETYSPYPGKFEAMGDDHLKRLDVLENIPAVKDSCWAFNLEGAKHYQ